MKPRLAVGVTGRVYVITKYTEKRVDGSDKTTIIVSSPNYRYDVTDQIEFIWKKYQEIKRELVRTAALERKKHAASVR